MASEDYPLHASVFEGDKRRVAQLIRTHDLGQKDVHGNTPLHLAVMLGHKECVHLLLAHNAPVKTKNLMGWTPLAEAISYGNRQTILFILRKLKQQAREALEERRPALIQALTDIGDFYLELKWDFHSWVPLVSRMLPSDVCKIYKKGSCIRLDTTLVDFNDMHWERGDISFIFNGSERPQESLTVLDNKLGVFQKIRYEESDLDLEDEVDILMSSDIVAAQMSTKNITFSRAQSGWLFREDKTEMVGEFKADFYYVNNLVLESRKRNTARLVVAVFVLCLTCCGLACFKYDVIAYVDPADNVTHYRSSLTPFYRRHREVVDGVYQYAMNVGVPTLSLLGVMTATSVIAVHIRRSVTWRKQMAGSITTQTTSTKSERREMAITRMLVAVCLMFTVCTLPTVTLAFVRTLTPGFLPSGPYTHAFYVSNCLMHLLSSINSSVNFFIYFLMGSRFRLTLRQMLGLGSFPSKAAMTVQNSSSINGYSCGSDASPATVKISVVSRAY